MSGENVDAFGIRFYGDFDSRIGHDGSFSEIFSDPDAPPVAEHERITLWFIFEKIRPYDKVSDLIRQISAALKKKGYMIKVSSVDGLVDTTSQTYSNKPERHFPASYRMHGCNAATGFSITAEKVDAKLKFTVKEIVSIKELAVKFGQNIYGRTLKMVDVKKENEKRVKVPAEHGVTP